MRAEDNGNDKLELELTQLFELIAESAETTEAGRAVQSIYAHDQTSSVAIEKSERPPRRRALVLASALTVLLVAVVVSALIVSHRGGTNAGPASQAKTCGSLPQTIGNSVGGARALLKGLPATVQAGTALKAQMTLATDANTPSVVLDLTQDTAIIYLVDDAAKIVGSANFASNAVGPIELPRTIGATGTDVPAAGGTFQCVNLDDPAQAADQAITPGSYGAVAVLSTSDGELVSSEVSISVR